MSLKFATSLEDARKKRCPNNLLSACQADKCMAWRFVRTHVSDGDGGMVKCGESHGFCGLAVDPRIGSRSDL